MITGKYEVAAKFAGQEMTGVCELTAEGDVLKGQIESMGNIIEVEDGTIEGDAFKFKCMFQTPMGLVKAKASGSVTGDDIELNLKALIGKVKFTGKRIG